MNISLLSRGLGSCVEHFISTLNAYKTDIPASLCGFELLVHSQKDPASTLTINITEGGLTSRAFLYHQLKKRCVYISGQWTRKTQAQEQHVYVHCGLLLVTQASLLGRDTFLFGKAELNKCASPVMSSPVPSILCFFFCRIRLTTVYYCKVLRT